MIRPAPLGFLWVVVGGWILFRVAALAPQWGQEPDPEVQAAAAAPADAEAPGVGASAAPPLLDRQHVRAHPSVRKERFSAALPMRRAAAPASAARFSPLAAATDTAPRERPFTAQPLIWTEAAPRQPFALAPHLFPAQPRPPQPQPQPATGGSRWSGSTWLYVRQGGGRELARGGTLGGSQAGARLTYRINGDPRRPVALSARLYAPLDRPQGAEAALGVDWQPVAALPLHILAERRERIGREGRSDFSLSAYGGGERHLLSGRLRLEAYGQAGVVGVEARDLFADGAARATVRIGPVEAGAGAWGGAQPGASRLDVGPQLSTSASLGPVTLRASAEWRFRVAGDAAPASGPALTISAGF